MQKNAPIQTTFAPDRPATAAAGSRLGGKTIYCEKCYLEAVY